MIRYALHCAAGHDFESWFASASAFEALEARGLLNCAICGGSDVRKALMAPAVTPPPRAGVLSAPASPQEEAILAMRRKIETESEYVGMDFATEARRIHEGEAPGRSIWGETKPEEARQLLEDGVPVTALPFMGPRKTN